jgi:hypothetical protein
MHLGGVARSAGGAERKSRGREGEKFLIYTGPEGKPGGESRFPLSFKTDGVCNTKLFYFILFYFLLKKIYFFKGPLGAF